MVLPIGPVSRPGRGAARGEDGVPREHLHAVWQRTDLNTLTLRGDSWNYDAHRRAAEGFTFCAFGSISPSSLFIRLTRQLRLFLFFLERW